MLDNLLSVMIFLPMFGGVAILLLPFGRDAARTLGLAGSVVVALFSLKIFLAYDGSASLAFSEQRPLLETIGISYHLGIDGISLLVLMAAGVLFPLVYLLFRTKEKGYYGNLLLVQGAMIGAVSAADMVLFYVFWEIMLLPIFFMIGLYGGPKRLPATIKITLYTITGSLLMLASIVYLGLAHHTQTGQWSFSMAALTDLSLSGPGATIALLGFMAAFAIKIPLFPFHSWLPDAYTEAPAATTFVLSAIMAKIGVYGVIRFVLPVFDESLARYALLFSWAGVVGMLYCGLAALAQKDFKRLLAFSSASHMGIIALGVFCLNIQALTGTLYQIVAHATSTGLLFLLLGLVEEQSESRQIESFGGLAARAPILAVFFAVAMLASVGLPGTSGFVGEFLIILGAVKFNVLVGVLAATTLIVGVCYMLWLYQRVFFQKAGESTSRCRELSFIEVASILPVIVLIVVMGIYPQPFLDKITPSVERQITGLGVDNQVVDGVALNNQFQEQN